MKKFPKIIVSFRCDFCRGTDVFRFDNYGEFKDFYPRGWDMWKGEVLHGSCSRRRKGGNVSEQDVLAKGGPPSEEMRGVFGDKPGVGGEGQEGKG